MSKSSLKISWVPRHLPLPATVVVAEGICARQMATKLLVPQARRVREQLRGVVGKDLLVLMGETEVLPWVDGCSYLGRDSGAPSLFVPTLYQPSVPVALLEQALVARHKGVPLAVLLDPVRIVSLAMAKVVDESELRKWLGDVR
jgi:hypothetical protein